MVEKYDARVLFPFVGDSVGGSHISAVELIRELPRNAVEPLVTLNIEGALASYLRDRNIPYKVINQQHFLTYAPVKSQLAELYAMVNPLRKFIKYNNIDIVHTNDARMHLTWTVPAKLSTARHIWHQRGHTTSKRFAISTVMTDQIISVSQYCLNDFPSHMRRRSQLVYDPFSQVNFSEVNARKITSELGIKAESNNIVAFVGNLGEQKRVRVFLQVAKKIISRGERNTQFLIFGNGDSERKDFILKSISDSNIREACIFMGPRFPIEPWLSISDILVAPAVNEGFGRTLVEAMLCNCLVVAADDGGHREIVSNKEVGYLVEPDNPDAFVKAIEHIMSNPVEAKLIKAQANTVARKKFSSEHHALEILKIYSHLLKKPLAHHRKMP